MTLRAKAYRLPPLLKYPGGKEKELKYILPALPDHAADYYEPFVGGGAVYLAMDADHYYINDKSEELMGLYELVKEDSAAFFDSLRAMDECWQFLSKLADEHRDELLHLYRSCREMIVTEQDIHSPVDEFLDHLTSYSHELSFFELSRPSWLTCSAFLKELSNSFENKFTRMAKLESAKGPLSEEDLFKNLEVCLKNAFYMYMRSRYNHTDDLRIEKGERIALYYFMREYCYSSMFRYNSSREFNVPYGGISYNRKTLTKKIEALTSEMLRAQLSRTELAKLDFVDFAARYRPNPNDFVFLDPPYDTTFSSYDGNSFDKGDHQRLADYLIQDCPAYFMLIIKNTDYITGLYPEGTLTASGRPLYVYKFSKQYFVSFKDRNDKKAEHLMITNYPVPINLALDMPDAMSHRLD